jgi:hypothetical protein
MSRKLIGVAALALIGALSTYATDLLAIIHKVSENCRKIQSYSADVEVRYRLCPDWYDRIGRYDFQKTDSTRLVLIDTIVGTDTVRSISTRASFFEYPVSIVPSILIKSIMSLTMVGDWADSAVGVMDDSPSTCVVKVLHNTDTIFYSVDMLRWLITGLSWHEPPLIDVKQRFFYGFDKGVYYLRKAICSGEDEGSENGGYTFKNVRVNGVPLFDAASR